MRSFGLELWSNLVGMNNMEDCKDTAEERESVKF